MNVWPSVTTINQNLYEEIMFDTVVNAGLTGLNRHQSERILPK